ncbi:MAG: hypothetical protein SH817_09340 [Leptospira sp.]|nr:hypothetical protein [Leptospira sp.]
MYWKDLLNQPEEFLNDPNQIHEFSLKDHPEFPYISQLNEDEVLEVLEEFVKGEGHTVTIQTLFQYAPIFEMMLYKKNMPSIFG